MSEHVKIEDADGVRLITWDRPDSLNAMTIEMWHGTHDALNTAADDGARCVVLTGSGRAFCTGQDLGEFGDPRHAEPDGGFRGLMRALSQLELPLLAAVNGIGVGFGLTVVPWCDLAFMAPQARLRGTVVDLGVTAEAGASVALADTMGPRAAARYLLSGEWITAEAALRHGLVTDVFDEDVLVEETMRVAQSIAAKPPTSLRTTVRLMRAERRPRWIEAVEREYVEFEQLAGGEENIAAITAFFERR